MDTKWFLFIHLFSYMTHLGTAGNQMITGHDVKVFQRYEHKEQISIGAYLEQDIHTEFSIHLYFMSVILNAPKFIAFFKCFFNALSFS